jgi:Ser/Thr protein kinase RdoA (MazF antagonist)
MSNQKFPVTESTLSTVHLGHFLQKKYNLSLATECKLFRTGINHLYIITDGQNKFVFRIYTLGWRSKLEIAEEVRLLNHLKDNQIPISFPIADQGENFIQEFEAPEGNRFGVMFSFAEGEKRSRLTTENSYQVGLAMGRMHKVTAGFELQRVTYTPEVLLVKSLDSAKQFYKPDSEEMNFVSRTTDSLLVKYKSIDLGELRTGAIHLDIWFDNLHFNGDEVTIFDFDFCGNGWLCYDIAYFMVQLYNTNPVETEYQEKLSRFLEGYESIVKISGEERRIIPFLAVSIWFFYMGVQCEKFDTWSNLFLNEDHLKRFIAIIKKWIAYNKLEME